MFVGTAVLVQVCAVAFVGAEAGTVAYFKGDLEEVESKDIDTVLEATEKVIEKLLRLAQGLSRAFRRSESFEIVSKLLRFS